MPRGYNSHVVVGHGHGYYYAPYHFYRPYYSFRPYFSIGFGLWAGYPVAYPLPTPRTGYYNPYYYPYRYPYPYGGYTQRVPSYPSYPPQDAPDPSYPPNQSSPYPPSSSYPPSSAPSNQYPGSQSAPPDQSSMGGLSFDITPSNAEVVVDGRPMGTVGDYTPSSQPLGLEAGKHHVEIRASGYRTMAFDVDVVAGKVVPYQGSLQR